MTKNKKILLGVITILPFAFIILYVIVFFGMFITMPIMLETGNEPNPLIFFSSFSLAFIFIFIAVVISIGLMIYYIIHAANNPTFNSNDRLLWILVMVFAHQIGYIIYWYLKIWKEDNNDVLKLKNNEN